MLGENNGGITMPEQSIVEKTRKILVEDKGYPDPANNQKADKNGLTMYSQDDYKKNDELKLLLEHSSKCSSKESQPSLWTDSADYGKPEFVIINKNTNLAIAIECKPAQKINNHISPQLRNDNILVQKGDVIGKYACDGALHYAKFLSKKYDVIAIGISGIKNSDDFNITTFYWKHGQAMQFGEKDGYKYCFGPFYNLRLDTLSSYVFYKNFIDTESQKIIKEFNEEKASLAATELNIMLDGAGVGTTVRALLVSGLLLALRDKTFQSTYSDKEIKSKELQTNLHNAIQRVIDSGDIEDEFKKKLLKDKFVDTFNQQDLLDNNATKLRMVLSKLHETVYPCMSGDYSVDIIGKFYHEFLRYAKNGTNNGIKLTPSTVTELFCDLIELKVNDVIMDPALGTGGFLISAMNRLYKLVDKMNEADIENFFNDRIADGKLNEKEVKRLKVKNKALLGVEILTKTDVKDFIRHNQLVGCEWDPVMYALGCSNMILRGDGKSNILHGDCVKKEQELKNFNATVGMMNPPYSGSAYSIMEFVEHLCKCVKKESKVVVIVPTSAAHSDDYIDIRNRILKNNKLLGVMSMSLDLFKGIAGTVTCIMVFEAGVKHDFNKNVYFGNWKDDGYYWHKTLGRVPDKARKHFPKTPDEYKTGWIHSFNNTNIDDEYGIWRKLTKGDNDICNDEWLWEYFVETDYLTLTQEDFEAEVKKYMLFQLKQLELSDIGEEVEMEDE